MYFLLRASLLILFAVVLAGCTTLGPDYKEPKISWLEKWQPSLYGQSTKSDSKNQTDLHAWWTIFNDPTLTKLIKQAQYNSPTMRLAGLRILQSQASLGIANSTLYPQAQQVGAGATYTDQRNVLGINGQDKQETKYSAGFNVGWELDFWGKFRRSIESADAAFFASVVNQQDIQSLLSAQMAQLYYSFITTKKRIAIAKQNVKIQKRSFEITSKIFKAGEGDELDVQQAKSQYLATESAIPQLETQLVTTKNAMALLLGRPPGAVPELKDAKTELPDIDHLNLSAIPAELLLRRPDVREAAWQVAAQSAQIGVATADYYPSISLLGNLNWSALSLTGDSKTFGLGIGPSLSWNIFDYGKIKNNIRLQDARLQSAIENFQNTALKAAEETDNAAYSIVKTQQQYKLVEESVISAERSYSLASKRYQEGLSDFQRVLDAQKVLASQKDSEVVVNNSHINSIINLYRALGGGWNSMTLQDMLPKTMRDTMKERTNWGNILDDKKPEKPKVDTTSNSSLVSDTTAEGTERE